MGDKKNMEQKEFEKRFCEEMVELLVLTKESVGGAAVLGDMLRPSLDFIAAVNVKTGELSREKGRLEWLIENIPGRKGWGYDFKQFGIYHIKARRNIPVKLEPYMSKTANNCYMIVEVVEKNVSEPRLEEIKEQISKPVVIVEEGLGEFVLDRQFSFFEGDVEWLDEVCHVFLETDEEDGDTAGKALAALKILHQDLKLWDDRFREYAADKLTSLANDWLQEEEGEEPAPITKESFAGRLEISELSIAPDGDITVYYDDDDMFWGHAVEVDANINGELSDAEIVG